MVQERFQYMLYSKERNGLLVSGRKGGIYFLDQNLNCVQASMKTDNIRPISAMVATDRYIFTRSNFGQIVRWDLYTLRPIDILYEGAYADRAMLDEDDSITPSINHALTLFDSKVYALNGFGQLLEIDPNTCRLLRVLDPNKASFIETIEVSRPDTHVLSDFSGWLYFGNLSTGEFEKRIRVDRGPVHCVRYDKRHDRYWASTDNSYGFSIVSADGKEKQHYKMTLDDVEWITFDESHSSAYIACFDHHLYVYSNENEQAELKRVIGPFKFQLKQVLYVSDHQIYILLESGEIYQIDQYGNQLEKTSFEGNCVWGVDAHPEDDSLVYCALEDGSVSIVRYGIGSYQTVELSEVTRHRYAFGRVRRARPLPDGSYLAVTTSGTVFLASGEGTIRWRRQVPGIVRDVDLNVDFTKALIGTEAQYAAELDVETGELLQELKCDLPVWAVTYDHQGNRYIGCRNQKILILDKDDFDSVSEIYPRDNVKRFRRLENGNILMNGPEGVCEIDTSTKEVVKRWTDWVTTTVENAIVFEQNVYTVSYNLMICSYDYESTDGFDVQLSTHDFPKGIAARKAETGESLLLVGGRAPYVAVYLLQEGVPHKVRELFL
ncbi:hypothetical protein [Tumebacillus lipolyticus]|uniref:WD40 repeat domain-containing protein n=1 Tax=Tumebacillus lipolyticus TaxID=1280370 RepID=A0ABW5A3W7_9BACL